MANKRIGQAGLALIKQYEGCRLAAYRCAAGVWTIGYGHTAGVHSGMTITQAQADAYLQQDIAKYMKLKTSKDTYEIVSANHENGKLNIVFENQSCESLQDIFSVKNDLARLEIYDHDERTSIITEYVVLERVVLEDNHATVVLGRESDDYSQRVTDLASKLAEASATASEMAEKVTATNKTVDGNTTDIQKLAADMDYLAMQMEVTLDE